MIPDDLAAIRARDAEGVTVRVDADEFTYRAALYQADFDRRALLAEVDRLTDALREAKQSYKDNVRGYAEAATANERARIRAEVEGLVLAIAPDATWREFAGGVLAIIDGGEA